MYKFCRKALLLTGTAVVVTALTSCSVLQDFLPGEEPSAEAPRPPEVVSVQTQQEKPALPPDSKVLAPGERPPAAGEQLPVYASGSALAPKCDASLEASSRQAAVSLARQLAAAVQAEPGAVYIAATVIPGKFADCLDDISADVADGMAVNPALQVLSATSPISQNAGSASTLPLQIRSLRAAGVPYLVLPVIRDEGKGAADASLTLRFVQVSNGVTVQQVTQKL